MNNLYESNSWVAEKVQIAIPAVPVPALPSAATNNGSYAEAIKTSGIKGVTTRVTSVNAALERRDTLVSEYRARLKRGDPTAAQELLLHYPELIHDLELRSLLTRWIGNGRMRNGKGRPKGICRIHPLWLIGIVHELLSEKTVKSKDEAFRWLENHKVILYETAKDAYYNAQHEPRFKAFLVKLGLPIQVA